MKTTKTLTLVIPVFNEGLRIRKTITQLKKGWTIPGLELSQIIFANDGSKDVTLKILQAEKKALETALQTKVSFLTYKKNRGRGYAVRSAALLSKSDYVLYTDADFSIPLSNLPTCLPFIQNNCDLVIGSKKKPGARELIKRTPLRRVVGYGHTIIATSVLGVFAWDFQGGFKLFSRKLIDEIFSQLQIDRWGFDMEVIFLAKKYHYKFQEIPVVWEHVENDSKVKLARDIYRSIKEMSTIKWYWLKGTYNLPSSAFSLRYKPVIK